MCNCNQENVKMSYGFTMTDAIGIKTQVEGEEIVVDETEELPIMLEKFAKFLNMCGYSFIEEIRAVKPNGDYISSEWY